MKLKNLLFFAIFLIFLISLLIFFSDIISKNDNQEENEITTTTTDKLEYKSFYDGNQGSTGYLEGKTVIVSIFADDINTNWDVVDLDTKLSYNAKLKKTTEWLSSTASKYNKKAEFVYDFEKNPDLLYSTTFSLSLEVEGPEVYFHQSNYIKYAVKSEELKKKYKADNILYVFFINSSYKNDVNPRTFKYSYGNEKVDVEYVNLFTKFKGVDTPIETYVHEILHIFGAVDLYYSSKYVPEDYVNYCNLTKCDDIMYSVYTGDDIQHGFSDIDAYYVGLIDKPSIIDEYNFRER